MSLKAFTDFVDSMRFPKNIPGMNQPLEFQRIPGAPSPTTADPNHNLREAIQDIKEYRGVIRASEAINKGADVNAFYKGQTPLMHAATLGRNAIGEMLIDNGASVYTRDERGQSAMFHAEHWQHIDFMQLLYDKGGVSFPDNEGNTVLHYAAYWGHKESINFLLGYHHTRNRWVHPDIQNKDGDTALHWAAQRGQADAVELLVNYHAATFNKNKMGELPIDSAYSQPDFKTPLSDKYTGGILPANRDKIIGIFRKQYPNHVHPTYAAQDPYLQNPGATFLNQQPIQGIAAAINQQPTTGIAAGIQTGQGYPGVVNKNKL